MAYRRSIIARAKTFYQHQPRLSPPPFLHITGSDREESPTRTISTSSQICGRFLVKRNNGGSSSLLSASVSRLMGSRIPASYGLILHRNLSNVPSGINDLNLNGVVGEVGDKALEAAPAVNEVAIAAADSFAPVAAFQYLIDYVRLYTGFEWWASIAATALLFRLIFLPHRIHQLRVDKQFYHVQSQKMMAVLSKLRSFIKVTTGQKPAHADFQRGMAILFECIEVVGEIKPLRYIMSDISACLLFFAILNMAKNVPSFVTGGTLWFTDLTTPDHSLRLPLLFALTCWFRIEICYLLQEKPGQIMNMVYPSLVTAIAVIAGFPAAIYCYGISTNLFSIAFYTAMKNRRVQKLLGITLRPPSTGKKIR